MRNCTEEARSLCAEISHASYLPDDGASDPAQDCEAEDEAKAERYGNCKSGRRDTDLREVIDTDFRNLQLVCRAARHFVSAADEVGSHA